ncbi:unnamed protein product [Sphagnum troendelagicum]
MGRSRSYSPPVRRERSRSPASLRGRRRMDDEEGMRGDGGRSSRKHGRDRDSGRRCSSPPTSLLVRNISRASRPDDLRIPFERYGPVKDVYLPKDYHSGESRGFGFVQYMDPADAADAQCNMDRQVLGGREITVVFAEQNRKKPSEMRVREHSRGSRYSGPGGGSFHRHSPRQSPALRFRCKHHFQCLLIRLFSPDPINRMEREITARDRTSSSPPRYHAGHYSQSPSRFHDHELSFQRKERHAGPRTQATFSAKRSQSPVENRPGVNVTEKSWSRSPSPQANVAQTRSLSPE